MCSHGVKNQSVLQLTITSRNSQVLVDTLCISAYDGVQKKDPSKIQKLNLSVRGLKMLQASAGLAPSGFKWVGFHTWKSKVNVKTKVTFRSTEWPSFLMTLPDSKLLKDQRTEVRVWFPFLTLSLPPFCQGLLTQYCAGTGKRQNLFTKIPGLRTFLSDRLGRPKHDVVCKRTFKLQY